MASFKTLDDLGDVTGKRVLVRVDLNVPMADGAVTGSLHDREARRDHGPDAPGFPAGAPVG